MAPRMSSFPSSSEVERVQRDTVAAIVVLAPEVGGHDVGRAETVRSVVGQRYLPKLLVVVDTAPDWRPPDPELTRLLNHAKRGHQSADSSQEMRIVEISAAGVSTFGDAVTKAVSQVPEVVATDWLWLLHDDMVAAPDALERLVEAGRGSRNIGAIGPKQVKYGQREQLIEAGIEATTTARRVHTIEPDEMDQGQHDGREEVLAIGSGGALVRRDLFIELGGLDPNLGPFGDGLEFSRRVWLSGHRVVVAPGAVVEHAQVSYGHDSQGRSSFSKRRRAQLYNWGLAVPTWNFVPYLLWLPLLTLGRSVARLFSRHPLLAFSEWSAYFGLVGMLPAMLSRRAHLARVANVPRSAIRELETPPSLILKTRRSHRKITAKGTDIEVALDDSAVSLLRRHRVRAAASFWGLIGMAALLAAIVWYPYTQGIQGGSWGALPNRWQTLVAQAWSGWQVSGDGLAGPAAPLLAVFSIIAAPFSLIGINPSALAQMALFLALPLAAWGGWGVASTFSRSNVIRIAGGALWAGGATLALISMWGDLAALTVYLLAPGVIIGLARALRPQVVLWARGVEEVGSVPSPSRLAWAGFAALCSAGIAAAAPIALVILPMVAFAMGNVAASAWDEVPTHTRQPGKATRVGTVLAVFVPGFVLVLPALINQAARGLGAIGQWLTHPSLPFLGWTAVLGVPGPLPISGEGSFPDAALAGSFTLVGLILGLVPPAILLAWSTGCVIQRALDVSARGSAHRVVTVSWLVSVALLALAVGQASLPVSSGEASTVLIVGASLAQLVAVSAAYGDYALVAPGLVPTTDTVARVRRGLPALLSSAGALLAVVMLLVLGPVGGFVVGKTPASQSAYTAGNVTLQGLAANEYAQGSQSDASADDAPAVQVKPDRAGNREAYVDRAPKPVIPMIAQDAQNSPRAGRLLTLSIQDSVVQARLLRGAGLQLADFRDVGGSTAGNDAGVRAEASLLSAVATLTSRANPTVAQQLAEHDVDLVMLEGSSEEFEQVQNVLDATAGLEKIGSVEDSALWRVRPAERIPARVTIVPGNRASGEIQNVDSGAVGVDTFLETEGGILVLSEVQSARWKATFDGEALEAVDGPNGADDWRQAFLIPGGEGDLVVRYEPGYLMWWWVGSGLSLGLVALLAVPRAVRRRRLVPALMEEDDG